MSVHHPTESIDYALAYLDIGWQVFPVRRGDKHPLVKWREQGVLTDKQAFEWWSADQYGIWLATGVRSGVMVLDCDTDNAIETWKARLGDAWETAPKVTTARGVHLYFGCAGQTEAEGVNGLGWELRGDGQGVIVPPTIHASGSEYVWEGGWDRERARKAIPMPQDALSRAQGGSRGSSRKGPRRGQESTRKTVGLEGLLQACAAMGEGEGRNDHLTRIAGMLAREMREDHGGYLVAVEQANARFASPLADREWQKVAASIWSAEQSKEAIAEQATGWLVNGDRELMTACAVGQGEDKQVFPHRWLDASLVSIGQFDDGGYLVKIERSDGTDDEVPIESRDIASDQACWSWLAANRVNRTTPPYAWHPARSRRGSADIGAFLASQRAERIASVEHMGWGDEGFITADGVITAEGLGARRMVVRQPGHYEYGFGGRDKAQEVLREVMTFHDERVCAVIGAWWAACLLKGQLVELFKLFPALAVEATSGSGKTTGFISLMVQLNGNRLGGVAPTKATFRDYLATNRNGIAWVDDKDDISELFEVLRLAPLEGTMTLKSPDRSKTLEVGLCNPILLTGEGLGLSEQKALLDRVLLLTDVPSPTSRMSRKGNDRRQFADVLDLERKHPASRGGLSVYAGEFVQWALEWWESGAWQDFAFDEGSDRLSSKLNGLMIGAHLLSHMTGDSSWVIEAAAWAREQREGDVGAENALTLRLIPEYLTKVGVFADARSPDGRMPMGAVVVKDDEVWVCPVRLAAWIERERRGRINQRLETEPSLIAQLKALKLAKAKRMSTTSPANNREYGYFWNLGAYSSATLARAGNSDLDTPVLL